MTGRKLAEAEPERESDIALVSTISTRLIGQVLSVSSPELLCERERQGKLYADGSFVVYNKWYYFNQSSLLAYNIL